MESVMELKKAPQAWLDNAHAGPVKQRQTPPMDPCNPKARRG
eukprot:gene287-384_t